MKISSKLGTSLGFDVHPWLVLQSSTQGWDVYSKLHIQASRVEILNDGGYRSDGRRQHELRDITIDLSVQGQADGSATLTQGLTKVVVSVFGPREPKLRSQSLHNRANINVDVNIAPFSTGERRKRNRGDK